MCDAQIRPEHQSVQRLSPDPGAWTEAEVEALCHHPNLHVQAAAMEERSRRTAPSSLTQKDVFDARQAKAEVEMGPAIEQMLRRDRRQRLPRLKKQLASQGKRFCEYANREARRGPPGYRDAGEVLRRYLRQEITAQELSDVVNANLEKFPSPPLRLTLTLKGSRPYFTIDDGGAMDGWRALLELVRYGVKLNLFKVCQHCERLFYDPSPRGDMGYCDRTPCQRQRQLVNQWNRRLRLVESELRKPDLTEAQKTRLLKQCERLRERLGALDRSGR
jgi:hypothetical protein